MALDSLGVSSLRNLSSISQSAINLKDECACNMRCLKIEVWTCHWSLYYFKLVVIVNYVGVNGETTEAVQLFGDYPGAMDDMMVYDDRQCWIKEARSYYWRI